MELHTYNHHDIPWDILPSTVHCYLHWVSCELKSSYSFVLFVLKLCMSFLHSMKIACDLDIIFRSFLSLFPHCGVSHFSPTVYKLWVPCEQNSSYNFILIFLKLCTCFLHSLKLCMCFWYNLCLNFCHFTLWTLSFSDLRYIMSTHNIQFHDYVRKKSLTICFLEIFKEFCRDWKKSSNHPR